MPSGSPFPPPAKKKAAACTGLTLTCSSLTAPQFLTVAFPMITIVLNPFWALMPKLLHQSLVFCSLSESSFSLRDLLMRSPLLDASWCPAGGQAHRGLASCPQFTELSPSLFWPGLVGSQDPRATKTTCWGPGWVMRNVCDSHDCLVFLCVTGTYLWRCRFQRYIELCASLHPLIFRNPTPGIVINRPNGSDVYHGVPKDYTGEVRQSAGSEPAGSASFQWWFPPLSCSSGIRTSLDGFLANVFCLYWDLCLRHNFCEFWKKAERKEKKC